MHGSPSGKRHDLQGAMLKKKYSSIMLTGCDTIFDLDCRWLLQTFGKCPALPHWRHFFSVAGQGLLFGKCPFTTLAAFCLCGGARFAFVKPRMSTSEVLLGQAFPSKFDRFCLRFV